jgi:iron(III) transport system substrate-binding protein
MKRVNRRHALLKIGGATGLCLGCFRDEQKAGSRRSERASAVTVYTALDEEFSKPILGIYARKFGVEIKPVFDVESTKSFGLTGRIKSEAEAPLCDLFWNNEILNTIRLKQAGLLERFVPAGAEAIPAAFKDRDQFWYGFAARARVLLVNTRLVGETERPTSLQDLLDPKWKGSIGLAKPLFGTTGTHAAALFVAWGDAAAMKFFRQLKENGVNVLSGNRQVAAEVAAGRLAIGLTDTDDSLLELNAGSRVAIVYPDRGAKELGTLFMPNTLSRIKGCRHPEATDALASYLLSAEVEKALAIGPSGQIPLNPAVRAKLQVETPATVKPMEVSFENAATRWEPTVAPFLAELFAESD